MFAGLNKVKKQLSVSYIVLGTMVTTRDYIPRLEIIIGGINNVYCSGLQNLLQLRSHKFMYILYMNIRLITI